MPFQLHFSESDLLRCRFALSPLFETQEAVRTLARRHRHGYHLPWLRRIRAAAAALDLEPLWLLMPDGGHNPDFICPPPIGPFATFDEEIAGVRAVDPEVAWADMALALAERPGARESATGRRLLADPARAVHELADLLEQVWRTLIEPYWPRLRALLEADIAYHSRRLADSGLEGLLGEMSTQLSWNGSTLTVKGTRGDHHQVLGGQGLVLMPSVLVWPEVVGGHLEPWQPGLIYPARGIGGLWSEAGSGRRKPSPDCWAGSGPMCCARWTNRPGRARWRTGWAWPPRPCRPICPCCAGPGC
ncbi:ArsR family transcriptional regulator [Streptomyces badius]